MDGEDFAFLLERTAARIFWSAMEILHPSTIPEYNFNGKVHFLQAGATGGPGRPGNGCLQLRKNVPTFL
jgi:hypothetical protein